MFVRTKKFTDRTVLQIVKSVRDGNKVRQKVVRHVGTATSEEQLIQLSKFGQLIIEEMKQADSAQTHLFTPKQYAELLEQNRNARQKPVPERVKLKNCREESRIALGLREVMAQMYRLLGWEHLLGARRIKANRILQELVLARIAQPLSKRATVRELDRFGDLSLNLEQVYNTMDDLNDDVIESICQQSHEMVKKIYTEPIEVIFYDTTTLYFESESSDSLREKGYSKDGKHHRVQLVFALLTTPGGMPVGYQIFPGSMYEGHTLSESFDKLRKRFAHAQFTLVADAGMINKDNQKWLEDNGIAYVMGARLKSQSESFHNKVLKADDFKPWGDSVPKQADVAQYKVLCQNARQVIVTYSPRRARKDAHKRAEGIEKLNKRLQKSKQPKSVSQRGYARFLNFPEGQVAVDQNKVEKAARWDGIHGIVAWGLETSDPRELVRRYRRLWEIEACFRTNKHDLKIRPIYHWKPKRVRAHIAICYMVFCCVQHVRYRLRLLGHEMSADVIRRELNALQVSILVESPSQDQYGMPSRASSHAKRIYRSVGLSWNERPFAVSATGRKRKQAAQR